MLYLIEGVESFHSVPLLLKIFVHSRQYPFLKFHVLVKKICEKACTYLWFSFSLCMCVSACFVLWLNVSVNHLYSLRIFIPDSRKSTAQKTKEWGREKQKSCRIIEEEKMSRLTVFPSVVGKRKRPSFIVILTVDTIHEVVYIYISVVYRRNCNKPLRNILVDLWMKLNSFKKLRRNYKRERWWQKERQGWFKIRYLAK